MKTKFFLVAIAIAMNLHAQLGIGVPNPTELLEVDGNTAISKKMYLDGLTDYTGTEEGFHLIAINPSSDNLKGNILEFTGNQEIMPIIVQPYEVQNVYRDDLNNFNLNISTNRYAITVSNFQAIPSTTNSNEPNQGLYKINGGTSTSSERTYGNFQIEAFEEGGTWRVRIGSPTANTRYTSNRYTYKFDVILFPKRFFKNVGQLQYNLSGNNSGSANSAPNL